MGTPKIQIVFFYDLATGAPLTGLSPTFTTYKDDLGNNLAQPSISEVGGGAYKFTPTFPTDKGVAFVMDGGATANPRYQASFLRAEDFYIDRIEDLYQESFGKWRIHTSGGDANRLVLYKTDGVTVLQKFDLADAAGAPTTLSPYIKTPV